MDSSNERLERLIGLRMDGRLGDAEAIELDRRLEASDARTVEYEMTRVRELLRSERAPEPRPFLRERIEARVRRVRSESRVLGTARWLAAAAAVLLCVGIFSLSSNDGVMAAPDDPLEVRTIEDEFHDLVPPDGSLKEFLLWRYMRRAP